MIDKGNKNQRIATAEEKLREIANLEKKYGVLGICFSTKKGAALTLDNTTDCVIDTIKTAADLVARMDEFPLETPSDPE